VRVCVCCLSRNCQAVLIQLVSSSLSAPATPIRHRTLLQCLSLTILHFCQIFMKYKKKKTLCGYNAYLAACHVVSATKYFFYFREKLCISFFLHEVINRALFNELYVIAPRKRCPYIFFNNFRPICIKFRIADLRKIYFVTASFMKIGAFESILHVRS
jgi:hypothetical protein